MLERRRTRNGFNMWNMKTLFALLLTVPLAAFAADDAKKPEKKKPAAEKKAAKKSGSDKNVFQKAESNTGDFLNRNKLWTTHPDNKKKKE